MSYQLPAELEARCNEIQRGEQQGIPLTRLDYVLLALVTVVVPVVLLIIGASL